MHEMNLLRAKFLLLIMLRALLTVVCPVSAANPMVTGIYPHRGSYEGGTKLFVSGKGFSTEADFGQTGGNTHIGNEVILVSDVDTVVCEVISSGSYEDQIICYTGRLKVGHHYYIDVTVDGRKIPDEYICYGYPMSSSCRFYADHNRTPRISKCHVHEEGVEYPLQTSFPPGGLITLIGQMYTTIYSGGGQHSVAIQRLYLGDGNCELFQEPDVPYGPTGGNMLTCKATLTSIGPQHVSLVLSGDYGKADVSAITKTNGIDELYTFQTFAEITNISPQLGSLEGGTRVTILGRHFDDSTRPLRVEVGRVPCTVVPGTFSRTKIECITGSPPMKRDYYPGSRGVLVETWSTVLANTDEVRDLNSLHAEYESYAVIDSSYFQWNYTKDYFVGKFTGVFVAPQTDTYRFTVFGDEVASLYANCNGTSLNLTKVASSNPYDESEWMYLFEGQECYFESTMLESRYQAYMGVAVHRSTTGITKIQSVDAKTEIQQIKFSATPTTETQELNFTWPSTQSGVAEVQEITLQHNCISMGICIDVGVGFGYGGITTEFLPIDVEESFVADALAQITELKDEGIVVTRSSRSADSITYSVQFNGMRGDYSLLTYQPYPMNVNGLNVSIEETVKGVSEGKSFKLSLGGRTTTAIPRPFNGTILQDAFETATYADCSSFMSPDSFASNVLTVMDFEKYTRNEYGTRVKNVEPFCGHYSIRNKEFIYRSSYDPTTDESSLNYHTEFDATKYKWLCLAHRGIVGEEMTFYGKYIQNGNTGYFRNSYNNPLQGHETQWRYSCINLFQVHATKFESSRLMISAYINKQPT